MKSSRHRVSSDGTKIWFGTVGKGPVMVLCDGLACDGFIWPYLIDHFCEDFTIVRWHYRGHGISGKPADLDHLTLEHICHDLRGVLDDLQVDSAIFLGHSMGVQVLLQYYQAYPEQFRGLVALCGSYKRPLDTFHNNDNLLKMLPWLRSIVDWAPEALQQVWKTVVPARLFYRVAAAGSEINGELIRERDFLPYLEHVSKMDLKVFLRLIENLAEHTAEDILPTIAAPALIVAGEHDTFTPMYRSQEMNQLIPGSELLVVECGTHVAPLESPEAVNGAIDAFLERHGLRHKA